MFEKMKIEEIKTLEQKYQKELEEIKIANPKSQVTFESK